jgi:hypothetical protein
LGLHVELPQTFFRSCEVIYIIDIPYDLDKLWKTFADYDQKPYDFLGLLYLACRCIFPFLPKANLWQHTGMFLCTEWVTEVLSGTEDSTITPYQLYKRLSK